MQAIRFSDDYVKLPKNWEGSKAVLIAMKFVRNIQELKKTFPAFIEYDTKFRGKPGNYDLDFNEGLILVLLNVATGTPFTTIRRYSERKFRYYKDMLGKTFQLEKAEVR